MSKPIQPMKKCRVCGQIKPNEEMHSRGRSKKTGLRLAGSICKKCDNQRVRDARKANMTEVHRLAKRRRGIIHAQRNKSKAWKSYGIAPEEVAALHEKQGGACLICHSKEKKLVIDHCHNSGKFRGLICGHCNSMLGMAQDDSDILIRAAAYLRTNKALHIDEAGVLSEPILEGV